MENSETKARLSPCALGAAFGLLWGLSLLVLGLLSAYCNWGTPLVELLGSLYIGYNTTISGLGLGLLWGVIDGFIGGFLLAFFYNLWLKCCPCKSCKCK